VAGERLGDRRGDTRRLRLPLRRFLAAVALLLSLVPGSLSAQPFDLERARRGVVRVFDLNLYEPRQGRGRIVPVTFRGIVRLAVLIGVVSVLPVWGAPDLAALQSAVVWIRASAQSRPGAGVVIKMEGTRAYVLTAYHVVQAAWDARHHEVAVRFHRQSCGKGDARVLRGGNWWDTPPKLLASRRGRLSPDDPRRFGGFRCAVGRAAAE